MAAHIYGASQRGPRGALIPTGFDTRSAENGLWLCDEHGRQVDANGGADYPPQLLFLWKENREADAAVEMGDRRLRPMRAVSAVAIQSLRQPNSTWDDYKFGLTVPVDVSLAARTLLYAHELADASLIAHLLHHGLARPGALGKRFFKDGGAIEFSLKALRGPRRAEIFTAIDESAVEHTIGNERVFNVRGAYRSSLIDWCAFLASRSAGNDDRDVWQRLGMATQLDPLVLRTLIGSPAARSGEVLRRARVGMDGSLLFATNDEGIGRGISYDALSTGQQISVLVELCLLAAKASWAPSIIIVSQITTRLDEWHLESFQRQCAKAPEGTQIVVIENTPSQGAWGSDWLRVELSRRRFGDEVTYGA